MSTYRFLFLVAPSFTCHFLQVVGFVAGYVMESFRVTVYAVFGGVIIASLICVPDWGIFKGALNTIHALALTQNIPIRHNYQAHAHTDSDICGQMQRVRGGGCELKQARQLLHNKTPLMLKSKLYDTM